MAELNERPPIRLSIGFFIFAILVAFLLLAVLYAAAVWYAASNPTEDWARAIVARLETVAAELWAFVRPLLQLIVVVAIFLAVLRFLNVKAGVQQFQANNVQALLAVILVTALAIASLQFEGGLTALKELSLVVVGFYFGSRRSKPTAESVQPVASPPGEGERGIQN